MSGILKPLSCDWNDGISSASFEPEGFKRFIREHPNTSAEIRNPADGTVVGILHTQPIWEELFSQNPLASDSCPT
jgi:hypothetical protein